MDSTFQVSPPPFPAKDRRVILELWRQRSHSHIGETVYHVLDAVQIGIDISFLMLYSYYLMTLTLTDNTFEHEVLKSDIPVLVDFWAVWCQPCKMIDPIVEELASEYGDKMKFGKMNVDENSVVPQRFGVMSIPTTILFKGASEIGRQVGFSGKQAFEDLIKKGVN